MSGESVQIVERVLELFGDGDVGAIYDAGLITDDAVWRPAPEVSGERTYTGREEGVQFMREWTEDFEEWAVETLEVRDVGDDVVAVRQRQRATGKGSRVTVDLEFGSAIFLRDGKVTRIETYVDFEDALAAAKAASGRP